jgi:hypothetical protein
MYQRVGAQPRGSPTNLSLTYGNALPDPLPLQTEQALVYKGQLKAHLFLSDST